MSSKTSKRTNTRTHKGHTRKNGGVRVTHKIPLTEWSRWFYKNVDAGMWKVPIKFMKDKANERVVELLRNGSAMNDIKKYYTESMEAKYKFVKKYNEMFKIMFPELGFPNYVKKYSGDSIEMFQMEWALEVAILLKLRVIKIDEEHGPVGFLGDKDGNPKSLPRTIY